MQAARRSCSATVYVRQTTRERASCKGRAADPPESGKLVMAPRPFNRKLSRSYARAHSSAAERSRQMDQGGGAGKKMSPAQHLGSATCSALHSRSGGPKCTGCNASAPPVSKVPMTNGVRFWVTMQRKRPSPVCMCGWGWLRQVEDAGRLCKPGTSWYATTQRAGRTGMHRIPHTCSHSSSPDARHETAARLSMRTAPPIRAGQRRLRRRCRRRPPAPVLLRRHSAAAAA